LSNPLYDSLTATNITDPALDGFAEGHTTEVGLAEFRKHTRDYAETGAWLSANLVYHHLDYVFEDEPAETSKLWVPGRDEQPGWIKRSPSALLLAAEFLHVGKRLSDLTWRQFEEVIGEILELEGWRVELTRGSKDGGVDVIASCYDVAIGRITSVWQAKKYAESNKFGHSAVRELSGLLHVASATKGVLVTTSHLTSGAVDWVRRDLHRLAYKEKEEIEEWIKQHT
jgi:restriction system protein